jgi:hypothetical protein
VQVRLFADFCVVPACTGFVHDLTQPGTACKVCRTPPNEPTSHARRL